VGVLGQGVASDLAALVTPICRQALAHRPTRLFAGWAVGR
jgi:hypothetical protein